MDCEMKYVATCLFGLERLVGEEIDALGFKRLETIDGRVTFAARMSDVAKININLRYAQRVYFLLATFPAATFDELFEGTKAIDLPALLRQNDAFPVKGHSIKSKLTSIPACQKIVKKACVETMRKTYKTGYFEETGTKYQIEFFILKDICSIMIDTSGMPLHKRGYRPVANEAPIRETLAAAMVKMAHIRDDVLFWDPFCGSGTIPIEAALLITNTAPGLNRHFAFEEYPIIDRKELICAREDAKSKIITDSPFEAFATDIDRDCIQLTCENAKRAGVDKYIKSFCRNALDIETYNRRGTVVTNPPYGERMLDLNEAETLCRNMGKAFARLGSWQIYVISSMQNFQTLYGRRADKVRKLYNGMIPCNFYQFFKNNK